MMHPRPFAYKATQTKVTYKGPPTTQLLHLEKLGSSRRLSPQLSQDSDENGTVVGKRR